MVCAGLMDNCRACATQSLSFLQDLKSKVSIKRADPASVRIVIQKILQMAQVRQNINPCKNKNKYFTFHLSGRASSANGRGGDGDDLCFIM